MPELSGPEGSKARSGAGAAAGRPARDSEAVSDEGLRGDAGKSGDIDKSGDAGKTLDGPFGPSGPPGTEAHSAAAGKESAGEEGQKDGREAGLDLPALSVFEEGAACLAGDQTCAPTERILEPEVRKHHRRRRKLLEFTHSSTRATMLMLAAAILALIIENTPILPYFADFWHTFEIGFSIGDFAPHLTLEHFINDFLMALFFLLVGLEIKFEMTAGELVHPRKALLPIVAAAGGAIIPAFVYLAVNAGSGFERGWGVPMANDIAFCLGILALLGDRVPSGLRSFLSTLTIADDMIAITVIALFYTANLDIIWLLGGLALFGLLLVFNRMHIYDLLPYLAVGLGMWACFLLSGVHATIAGVLLAMAIPAKSQIKLDRVPSWFKARARTTEDSYDQGEPDIVQKEYLHEIREIGHVSRMAIPPITRLDDRLHVPVYFFILPLFAFSNASVMLAGMDPLSVIMNPVTIGVFCGLLFGKPFGIFVATWLVVKLRLSDLPKGVNWGHIIGVSILGGVGFTMAIFVTNLAFTDTSAIAMAKAAILAASMIAGLVGFFVLRRVTDEGDADDVDDGGDALGDGEEIADEAVAIVAEAAFNAADAATDAIGNGIPNEDQGSDQGPGKATCQAPSGRLDVIAR